MTIDQRLFDLVVAATASVEGVSLYDLAWQGPVLRVTVEAPGGVDLDAISAVTRALSRSLDEADPIPGAYQLEVSSPGLERVLRTPEHWAGAVGERVKVKTRVEVDGERRFDGVVASVEGDDVLIETSAGEQTLALDQIDKATTVFEWGPAPKPGSPAGRERAAATFPSGGRGGTEGGPDMSTEESAR